MVNNTVKKARQNQVGQLLYDKITAEPNKFSQKAEIVSAQEAANTSADNIVEVLIDGKPVHIRIKYKPLLTALRGLNNASIANNFKGIKAANKLFKSLITQDNPIFAVFNFLRDVPTAYTHGSTKNPVYFARDLWGSFGDMIKNTENYKLYKAVGGGMSNFVSSSNIDNVVEKLQKGAKGNKTTVLGAIRSFNNAVETSNRLAEFNRVFDETGDVQKALHASNNVSVNFAKGGIKTKAIDTGVPYFNAGFVGIDRFFQAFSTPKEALKTLVGAGIAVTIPEIVAYLINRENPNYKTLSNYTKDNYFLIPRYNGELDSEGKPTRVC